MLSMPINLITTIQSVPYHSSLAKLEVIIKRKAALQVSQVLRKLR